jgi:hypothetical protein
MRLDHQDVQVLEPLFSLTSVMAVGKLLPCSIRRDDAPHRFAARDLIKVAQHSVTSLEELKLSPRDN